jgi:hypothetical protein
VTKLSGKYFIHFGSQKCITQHILSGWNSSVSVPQIVLRERTVLKAYAKINARLVTIDVRMKFNQMLRSASQNFRQFCHRAAAAASLNCLCSSV